MPSQLSFAEQVLRRDVHVVEADQRNRHACTSPALGITGDTVMPACRAARRRRCSVPAAAGSVGLCATTTNMSATLARVMNFFWPLSVQSPCGAGA